MSITETTIRKLTLEDFDRGFPETIAALKPIGEEQHKRIAEIFSERVSKGIRTYVIEEEGRVVATGSFFIEPKYYGNVAFVEDIAVHSDYRERGFGRKIMAHIQRKAEKEKCYKIMLGCNDDNVGFYNKNGYRKHENQMRLDLN